MQSIIMSFQAPEPASKEASPAMQQLTESVLPHISDLLNMFYKFGLLDVIPSWSIVPSICVLLSIYDNRVFA